MSLARVAMFTPLPPAKTGTADYAEALIRELRNLVSLSVFTSVPRGFRASEFDTVIYQIANNPWHEEFYRLALQQPGIVVLHETSLHDLIRGMTLNRGDEAAYLHEVMYEIFGHDTPGADPRHEAIGAPQPRTFPMIRRLLDASRGCIVHSRYAAREVRVKNGRCPVAVIPHGAVAGNLSAEDCRRALGLDIAGPVAGLFGFQRPDKRAAVCVSAFRRISGKHPGALLVVAGEPHPDVPLSRATDDRIRMLGFQDSAESLDNCIAACDVVLNLRHPTCGETSGTMLRAFGLGRAVIVSDAGSFQEMPDDICLKIGVDPYEEAVLAKCLDWLFEDLSRAREIGQRARERVTANWTWSHAARMYRDFAESLASEQPVHRDLNKTLALWNQSADADAAEYFRMHRARLLRTLELTPEANPGDRVLELGCYLQIAPVLGTSLGYAEVRGSYLGSAGATERRSAFAADGKIFECEIDLFNVERDRFPYPDGHFATVICGEVLEHLESDPVFMMAEIHRILRTGGILVLTTPNVASLRAVAKVLRGEHPESFHRYSRDPMAPAHSREYTPDEIRLLLSECGFVPLRIETGPYEGTADRFSSAEQALGRGGFPRELRGECIFAVGRKEDLPVSRFPSWLYG